MAYLDHNATTPLATEVLEAMLPYLREHFGNAASRTHRWGQAAASAVERARMQVGELLGAAPTEILWTSGATEANNLALFGAFGSTAESSHLVTQATEHPAVLDPVAELGRRGVDITVLPVDSTGRVSPAAVKGAIRRDTRLVSIMWANNETGVIQPIREIGAVCRAAGALFHTDATQAVGKVPIDLRSAEVDMLSLSAHKIYGPKGTGALVVRTRSPRIRLHPLLLGGGHERGMRSGTINVPGVVGLGVACNLAQERLDEDAKRLGELRCRLVQGMKARLDMVHENAPVEACLPHVANLRFDQVEAEALLMNVPDLAASTGAACSSMKMEPSHVLVAMGLSEEEAFSSVRFSLGRFNTAAEIDAVVEQVAAAVLRLRSFSEVA